MRIMRNNTKKNTCCSCVYGGDPATLWFAFSWHFPDAFPGAAPIGEAQTSFIVPAFLEPGCHKSPCLQSKNLQEAKWGTRSFQGGQEWGVPMLGRVPAFTGVLNPSSAPVSVSGPAGVAVGCSGALRERFCFTSL